MGTPGRRRVVWRLAAGVIAVLLVAALARPTVHVVRSALREGAFAKLTPAWGLATVEDVELAYQHDRVQGSVNFFHSRQTDSITIDTTTAPWHYANLGEGTFRGVEVESKYYVTKQVFLLGSVLHQSNESGGVANITPIPNNSVKAGASYQGDEGLTIGVGNGREVTARAVVLTLGVAWRRLEIPKIEASPAFGTDGTIMITWDEGDDPPFSPRHVLLAVLGPAVKPGTYGGAKLTHYSLLRTIEDGFGVRHHLAHAAHAKAISQIWK